MSAFDPKRTWQSRSAKAQRRTVKRQLVGRRIRCIQCLKLLRPERQGKRDGVLFYMRRQTGFGNCNDVAASDSPGQRNSSRRATACCANLCQCWTAQYADTATTERRIGHHRHAMLLAPWQQVIFDAAVADVVRDLIGRAEIAVWNMEELFHVPDAEVGHTPGSNLPRRAETFERRDNDGQVGAPISPVREVKIEVFSPETGKARLASAHNGVSCRHVIHFGDQEYAVALTGNRAADQFLGAAVAVPLRRVNQRHTEGKPCAQRFLLNSCRMSPLAEMPRALSYRRNNGAVGELYGTLSSV